MTNDLKFTTAGDYMKMNERIEELAGQANLKLDELPDDTFIPLEKFAELIVRECIELNRQELSFSAFARMLNKYNEHFGVEEWPIHQQE